MQTIGLPKRVIEKFVKVSLVLEELQGELEDYLIARQPTLVKKLRRARHEHLAGQTRPFRFPR